MGIYDVHIVLQLSQYGHDLALAAHEISKRRAFRHRLLAPLFRSEDRGNVPADFRHRPNNHHIDADSLETVNCLLQCPPKRRNFVPAIGIGGVPIDREVALQILETVSDRAVEAAIFASDPVERSRKDVIAAVERS